MDGGDYHGIGRIYTKQCEESNAHYLFQGNPGRPASTSDTGWACPDGNGWVHLWLNPDLNIIFTDCWEARETGLVSWASMDTHHKYSLEL